MLALFPGAASTAAGVLKVDGTPVTELAERFGTPLVVYSEDALRERARLFRRTVPEALVAYGTKAFPNVAVMRLLAEEGVGADVSTLGELTFARRAGIEGERLLVHGNNKSDEELRAAAAGARRVLVRVTPGVEADTHEAIRTGHYGSKFGLDPDDALEAVRAAREEGLEVEGLHLHVGSQLADGEAHLLSVRLLGEFAARCRDELGWAPAVVDVGGGHGIRHLPEELEPRTEALVRSIADAVAETWARLDLLAPRLVLEPGRSLVGPAGFTLYRIGAVKRAGDRRYVAIDGGMSDNPRPQLYGARYCALLANRADEEPQDVFTIAGKHCESGDVLIEHADLPEPRRGDLIAVPATGAYTLGMASNYNGVPRPAAVLVGDGGPRLIRRRETIDDLLAVETD